MRIGAPWYSPVLPNGVVGVAVCREKALDFSGSHPVIASTGEIDVELAHAT